jgi:5-methylthioadenosine/S-adenosylhomocysteine deaminase
MDTRLGNIAHADVLIEGSRIIEVRTGIEAADAEVIDARHHIIAPGMVDTHRHLWETALRGLAGNWTLMQYLQHILGPLAAAYRPEDVYLANLLGALDWSHIMNTPDHADAAIHGLREAGIRARFGYGTPGTSVWEWFYESQRPHPHDAYRIKQQYFSSDEQLVTMALAIRGPEYSSMAVSRHDIALARELNLPVSMHIGCGTFGPRYQAVTRLRDAGLLGPDLNFAHCNTLTGEDFRLLADNGCSVSVTPEVEMQMGIGFPATGKALANGIRPGLGVDVVTGAAGDLLSQMKIALQTERALRNQTLLQSNEMPQTLDLTTSDVLQMATLDGARTLGLADKTGSITPGKQADIILIDSRAINLAPVNDPVTALVLFANPANIDSVFVAGKAVKRNGTLLYPGLAQLLQKAAESKEYLREKAGLGEEVPA